ncbi:hypothetical protein ABW20_dc0101107 [Dactylellina cionopaga]|nr:hypothetical protein ABW20_dc0101107 [Dactylellina cionopaga]
MSSSEIQPLNKNAFRIPQLAALVLTKAKADLHGKDNDIGSLKSRLDSYSSKLDRWNAWHKGFQKDFDTKYKDVQKDFDTKYNDLQQKFSASEREIAKLQRTELAIMRTGDVLMDEQAKDLIREAFQPKIQAISRRLFRKIPWQDVLQNDKDQDVLTILSKTFELPWNATQWPLLCSSPDFSTHTLVDALLSCTIATKLFQNPFFRCEAEPNLKKALDTIYSSATHMKLEAVDLWRAKTVTLINELLIASSGAYTSLANPSDTELLEPQLREFITDITTGLCHLMAFYQGPSETQISDLHKKVSDLVLASSKLANDWHCRELRIQIIDISWLRSEGITWDSGSASKYITHFSKAKKLEDGVNYTILAVISPGFIRYEKENGTGSYIEIVWEKACVLLSETDKFERSDAKEEAER